MALADEDKRWFAAQMGAFETRLDAKIEKLDGKIEHFYTTLDAKIERVETTLLTEFHKWASPREARLRTHSATLRTLDLELDALKDRVKRLEDQRPH